MAKFTGTVTAPGPILSLADLGASALKGQSGDRRFVCPLCDHTRQRHKGEKDLSVNLATGAWQCWHCGERGLLREYWTNQDAGRPKASARQLARERCRQAFALPPRETPQYDPADAPWRQWWDTAQAITDSPGARYLEGRGLNVSLAEVAGTRYTRDWFGRPAVLYPLRDRAGVLAAVGGRYTDGREPKARVGGTLNYGAFIFPGALAGPVTVIVEGPADVLALAFIGVSAVALHRTSAPAWLPKSCAFSRVSVALDADTTGDGGSRTLLTHLGEYGATAWRVRPDLNGRKDWADILHQDGPAALRRFVVPRLIAPAWAWSHRRAGRVPHLGLERAVAGDDWALFCRVLAEYENPPPLRQAVLDLPEPEPPPSYLRPHAATVRAATFERLWQRKDGVCAACGARPAVAYRERCQECIVRALPQRESRREA